MDGIEPASLGHDQRMKPQAHLVRASQHARVLELWHRREKSTHCISIEVGLDEATVCHIIDDAEGRAPKFGEAV